MTETITPKQQLTDWMKTRRAPNRAFLVTFSTPEGRTDPRRKSETFPWENDEEEILFFADGKDGCAFSTPLGTYSLTVAKSLVNRWVGREDLYPTN